MLSLNRLHRFHLINYDHDVAQSVVETILKFYRTSTPLQVSVVLILDGYLILRRSGVLIVVEVIGFSDEKSSI